MRIFTGLLLVSGAASLQLHKNIKLAAPALPVALLPSAVAAADSYEYGSARLRRLLHEFRRSGAPDRPRSRRPTDAAACRRPTRAGRRPGLGSARGGGPRHRDGAAAARARPCLNRPLLAAAARASRVAMPAQALKDGEEAAEEIFQQDESVRSLDSRKNRRV